MLEQNGKIVLDLFDSIIECDCVHLMEDVENAIKELTRKAELHDKYKSAIDHQIKKQGLQVCYHCDKVLSDKEYSNYVDNAKTCCSGHECTCMGMPVDPPYCDQCEETGVLATIGREVLKNASEGWWCPDCNEMLDGSRVTHQERCDTCGHGVNWIKFEWLKRRNKEEIVI